MMDFNYGACGDDNHYFRSLTNLFELFVCKKERIMLY